MKKAPWTAVAADAIIAACCVIACINALPTAFNVQYGIEIVRLSISAASLVLCSLIYLSKKKWPFVCLGFGIILAIIWFLCRGAAARGANIVWFSAARLWSLDISILPTPVAPEETAYSYEDATVFLLLAAGALLLAAAVLIIKLKTPIPALLLPIPFFVGCFIYTDCRPALFTIILLLIYFAAMLFGREIRKKDVRTAGRGRLVFLLLLTGGALCLSILSPQKKYDPIPFSQRRGLFDLLGPMRDDLLRRQYANPLKVDLAASGDRSVDEGKAFSVNCTKPGKYLLRTHSYGLYSGNTWNSVEDYTGDWISLNALGSTQKGEVVILRVRDAYIKERITPYAFSPREELYVGESYVRANGKDAYVWTFKPEILFRPDDYSSDEEKYYRFALEQYTLPDGPEKQMLLKIVDKMKVPDWIASSSYALYLQKTVLDPEYPYQTAINVANYVRSQGEYTLTPGQTPAGEDFVEYFLTKSHKGYCVHFASSTTALLQAIGIPARYVVGYRAEIPKADTWTDVPHYASHAWTEIYIKGVGWIPIESSAGFPTLSGYMQDFSWNPDEPKETDAPSDTPRPDIATPEPDITPKPTPRPTRNPDASPASTDAPAAPGTKAPVKLLKTAAIVIGIIAVWQLVGVFIRMRRNRAFNQKDSRAAVLAMLDYLESLIRFGAEIPENAEELRLEAAFSNHGMEEKQKELMDVVLYNRDTIKMHRPLVRFILKWVIFKL